MSKCESSARVRRVSSQAIRSTSRSTRSARAETSSRLPIGVATTKRVPRALRVRGLFVGFGDQHRPLVVQDHLARDDALLEPLDGRQLVHDLEHDFLQDRAQAAGARTPLERLLGDGSHRVVRELEADLLEVEVLMVLLDDRVLRLLEDPHQRRIVEVVQGGDDGQAADELRDETVPQQVLGLDHREQVAHAPFRMALDLGAEPHPGSTDAAFDVLVESDERAPADEQHIRRIDLDELLVRVLAAALGRHVGDGAFQDLEQRLLDAFARHVARDRRVLGFPRDFIDLVDVDDSPLRPLDVIVGGLEQTQNDVFHVLADVARFGERGRVGDRERHPQHLRECLSKQRFPGTGRTDQENIGLLQLDVAIIIARLDALVVVVDSDGEDLLGALLTDHVLVEDVLDLGGLGERADLPRLLLFPLLGDDVVAELDALVADVDGRARDELADVVLALAAEGALQRSVALTRPRHPSLDPYFWTWAERAAGSLTARVVGFEEITSSTILYSLACSAVMKKSRSVSRWIFSMFWPVWCTRMRLSSSRILKISRAWMSMSVAWPCTPPSGWWIMIRACGSANRLPRAPAHSSSAPIDAACPMQIVEMAGFTYCMVS